MEPFEPIDVEFLINKEEVRADAKKVRDDIKGIGDEAESSAAKANAQINQLYKGRAKDIDQTTTAIGKQKRQYDGLSNSLTQITRELPAFTFSAQTGFLAISNNLPILADEIGRLRVQNEALTASGQKAVPVWQQVTKSLFGWQTLLSVGVTLLTIYGAKVFSLVGEFFKTTDAIDANRRALDSLNKAYNDTAYQKAIGNIIALKANIDLAKKGIKDKEEVVKEYNKVLGDAAGEVDNLADAEQRVIDKAPGYVQAMLLKAAASVAQQEIAKELAESARLELELQDEITQKQKEAAEARERGVSTSAQSQGNFTNIQAVAAEQRQKTLNQEINDLIEERNELEKSGVNTIEILNKRYEEVKKKFGLTFGGDEDGPDNKRIVDQRKKLLEEIADLDREFARKQLDRDDAEVQALRDKFSKVRDLVAEFNKDPKNAKVQIDTAALDQLEIDSLFGLLYEQDTRKLGEELQAQQKLFQEFEEYKKNFGTEKAKERYAALLGEFQRYSDLVKQKIEENAAAFSAVEADTATGPQVDRVKLLSETLEKETRAELKAFQEQLAGLQDYNTQRTRIITDYQALRLQLVAAGADAEVAELDRQHKEELEALDDANVKKTRAYQELFESVGRLTISTGQTLLANARKLLDTQNLSAETRARILRLITETESDLKRLKADEIFKIGTAIGRLGESLQTLDNPALRNVGGLLSGLAGGVGDFLNVIDDEATTGDKIGAAVNSVVNLIGVIVESSARRKAAEEAYYLSVIGLQNDYNLALNEQIRLQSQLNESVFIKDYEGRITDALSAVRNANDEYLVALDKLENGLVKIGQRNALDLGSIGSGVGSGAVLGAAVGSLVPVIGTAVGAVVGGVVGGIVGIFGGKKKKDEFGSLLAEYPELVQQTEDGVAQLNVRLAESLIANDLLNDKTKQLVQNALDYNQAIEDAKSQIREVIGELSGSLSSDLRDTLVEAFTAGEDAALRMGDTVDQVLENIVGQLVFNNIFSNAFARLEDEMADSFDFGGDANWVDDFSRFFNEAQGLTDDFNEALRAAQQEAGDFGFDIFKPDDQQGTGTGLAGAIRRELTEETGSELTGLFRGQFDVTKRHLELSQKMFELDTKHYNATIAIMQHAALTEKNTRFTWEQLVITNSKLSNIEENTKGGQTSRDLGLGS